MVVSASCCKTECRRYLGSIIDSYLYLARKKIMAPAEYTSQSATPVSSIRWNPCDLCITLRNLSQTPHLCRLSWTGI